MAITSFQVQNILRTYAKQLSRGQRLARHRAASQMAMADLVSMSIETRRKQVIEKITSEIVSNIGSRLPGLGQSMGAVEEKALELLSREYGRKLDISQYEPTGNLIFKALDPEGDEAEETLSREESAKLQTRLFEITQEIVDRTMV